MGPKLPKTPAFKKELEIMTAPKAAARSNNPNVQKQPRGYLNVTEKEQLRRGSLNISTNDLKVKVLHLMEQVLYHTQV